MKITKLYKNAATTNDEQSMKRRKCDVGAIVIKASIVKKEKLKDILFMILVSIWLLAIIALIYYLNICIWGSIGFISHNMFVK